MRPAHLSKVVAILLGLVILLVCLWPKDETPGSATPSTDAANIVLPRSAEAIAVATTKDRTAAKPVSPPSTIRNAAEVGRQGQNNELQAYRIAVRGGSLSLDGTQRIFGDFHRRRGPLPWMPGMWCIRLLDANLQVLAEETANAPDHSCLVLDPQNRDTNGYPQATQFAGAGEESMLQVRLPPHPDAKWLRVYHLTGSKSADWNTEPAGRLLASIPLP